MSGTRDGADPPEPEAHDTGRRRRELMAKVVVPVVVAALIAIAVAALTPVGDGLRELAFPTSATVRGKVRMSGADAEGAAVVLDGRRRTESRSDGTFLFAGVGNGTHDLRVDLPGARVHRKQFFVERGAGEKVLETLDLAASMRLVADISVEAPRPGSFEVRYDVAVWVDSDDVPSGARRVTYRMARLSPDPVVSEDAGSKFCARLRGVLRLPEVPRGAVEASIELTNGTTVRLAAPELQGIPGGGRPAACRAM